MLTGGLVWADRNSVCIRKSERSGMQFVVELMHMRKACIAGKEGPNIEM